MNKHGLSWLVVVKIDFQKDKHKTMVTCFKIFLFFSFQKSVSLEFSE